MILQDIFQGRQFVLDLPVFSKYKEKQLLKDKITKNNGIISYTVTRKTNYIIRATGQDDSSYRTRLALKYGVRVVTEDFVDACLEKGKLVDSKLYSAIAEDNQAKNLFADGKIVTATTNVLSKTRNVKLSQVKAWLYKDRDGPSFHSDPYVVVKAVMLKGKEKQMNFPFCIIEIHCSLANENDLGSYLKFCLFTHQGVLPARSDAVHFGIKTCRFVETSDEALNLFEQMNKLYCSPPHSMTYCKTFAALSGLGSDCFQVEDWLLPSVLVEPKVAQFVTDIWTEASNVLDSILSIPFKNIKDSQILHAEGLLLDISKALLTKDVERVNELCIDYYAAVPHRSTQSLNTWSLLMYEYNICQLMRDMLFLQESISLSDKNIAEQQYFSLQCNTQCIEHSSSEYQEVESLIMENKESLNITICDIYKVHRSCEDMDFTYNIGNNKLLFHGSKVENVVGILSRGMLLSKNVFPQQENTNYGSVLGPGLYFSDELTAATNYAQANKTNGKRMLFISEVALGESYDMFSANPNLSCPPDGYNSIHGVKHKKRGIASEFDHNEYVVYNVNQQRLKYVVEFWVPGDKSIADTRQTIVDPNTFHFNPREMFVESNKDASESFSVSEFDIQQFLTQYEREVAPATVGLQSQASEPIPLKSVHVRAKLIDLAAEVVVMQEYHNDTGNTIEARYVFPLDDKAAVCGFEAFTNGQRFIGRIEEKKDAQEEYKQAIEVGKKAYLMDEEAPDVFMVSIGNVQPHSSVLVKIRYVAELDIDGDLISFRLPGAVSPWQQELGLMSHLQSAVKTVDVLQDTNIKSTVELFVDMPFDIKTLYSPTHQVEMKKTAAHAVVTVDENANLNNGFQLLIGLAEIHVPRMWVENHPSSDSSACMLTFYPEFVSDAVHDIEVILALDASNSMKGTAFAAAQQIAILCLHYLPPNAKFNILTFGTVFTEAFPNAREKSVEEAYAAQQFILKSQPTMGSSKVSHFLQSYFHLKPQRNTLRSVYVISDGFLQHIDSVLHNAARHNNHTRIFCLGVGQFVNSHFLHKIAHAGGGSYEQFDEKRKSKWASKAQSQMLKSEEPVITDINIEWQQFEDSDKEVIQAPKQITAVFSGSRLTVYGFVLNCSLAILKGNVSGTEVSTIVFTSELGKSTGTTLHGLATRAIVRDWESGYFHEDRVLHESLKKSFQTRIVALSKKYSIITPLTSFVAVEDKDNQQIGGSDMQPSIEDFVQDECVDFLQYLHYESTEIPKAEVPSGGGRGLGRGGIKRHRRILSIDRSRSRSPMELHMLEQQASECSVQTLAFDLPPAQSEPVDMFDNTEKTLRCRFLKKQGKSNSIRRKQQKTGYRDFEMPQMQPGLGGCQGSFLLGGPHLAAETEYDKCDSLMDCAFVASSIVKDSSIHDENIRSVMNLEAITYDDDNDLDMGFALFDGPTPTNVENNIYGASLPPPPPPLGIGAMQDCLTENADSSSGFVPTSFAPASYSRQSRDAPISLRKSAPCSSPAPQSYTKLNEKCLKASRPLLLLGDKKLSCRDRPSPPQFPGVQKCARRISPSPLPPTDISSQMCFLNSPPRHELHAATKNDSLKKKKLTKRKELLCAALDDDDVQQALQMNAYEFGVLNDEADGEWQKVKKGIRQNEISLPVAKPFARPLSCVVPDDIQYQLENEGPDYADGSCHAESFLCRSSLSRPSFGLALSPAEAVKSDLKCFASSSEEFRSFGSLSSCKEKATRSKQTARVKLPTKDPIKISTISLGAGLPFISHLLKRIVSFFGFSSEYKSLKGQVEEEMCYYEDDELSLPIFEHFNSQGAIDLDNLPKEWDHQLWAQIKGQLLANGLKSMGDAVRDSILSLIATMAVLLHVCQEINPDLFPLDLTNQDAADKIAAEGFESNHFTYRTCLFCVNSLLFITSVNQRHPLVYRSLELGNSWEEALHFLGALNLLSNKHISNGN